MATRIKDYIRNNFELIGYILLFIFFVAFNFVMYSNIDLILDSDKSSELLLAKIIADTKEYFSTTWYYSTELRILNMQLIYAPLFLLTDNFHIVRTIGSIIIQIILFISFYYACKKLGIKYIPYLAICICGAYCKDSLDFILGTPHYTPYVTISFFSLGLIADLYQKRSNFKTIMLMLLSFVSSLSSIRQLSIFYLPFFVSVLFIYLLFVLYKKDASELKDLKRIMIVSGIAVLFSIIGNYIGSTFISEICSIQEDQINMSLRFPSFRLIKELVYCLAYSFGYVGLFSNVYRIITIVLSLTLISFVVFIVLKNFISFETTEKMELITDLFLIISVAELFITMAFAVVDRIPRYFLPVVIFFVFVIGMFISKRGSNRKYSLVFVAFIFVVINSFVLLNYEFKNTVNEDLISFKDIILKEEAFSGYSTFWNGNVLIELADGKVDVYVFQRDEGINGKNLINNLNFWLQKKTHFEQPPEGKIFLILNDYEKKYIIIKNDCLSYEGKMRTLYIFDDYQDMMDSVLN